MYRRNSDHIEPVAENLYRAALGLYQGGKLDQATALLRQAVALNPNHLRANLLLADILLAQDKRQMRVNCWSVSTSTNLLLHVLV